jgi:hypothetical protein
LVEVLPHAIDDAVVELDSRNNFRIDRLGPHLLLRRERLAEGVGPGPCAERRRRDSLAATSTASSSSSM